MSQHGNEAATNHDNNWALWITYVNVALYALCYQLQRPIEPFLVERLVSGKDGENVGLWYGYIEGFFSFVQTVGSPLVGIILDKAGIRIASTVVFVASATSYAILSMSSDISMLFISKIPTALQHAFLIAQATAASSTAGEAERAAALGRMTTAYTIGATVGPAVGGLLADQGDFYVSARYAVLGSLLSALLSLTFLPNKSGDSNNTDTTKNSFLEDLGHSWRLAIRPSLWPLLLVKFLGGIGASIHSTALPLALKSYLRFDPSDIGFSMSTSMFAVAGFGAIFMAPLTRIFGSSTLTRIGLVGRSVSGFCFAYIVSASFHDKTFLRSAIMATAVCHALSSHGLATGLTTRTTGSVLPEEQGALLGLEHGLFSLARIVGPPIGSVVLASTEGLWPVELVCGALDATLLGTLLFTTTRSKSKKKS